MPNCLPESIPSLQLACVFEVVSEIRNPADWKTTAKKAASLLLSALDAFDGPPLMTASANSGELAAKSIPQLCGELESALPSVSETSMTFTARAGMPIWLPILIELLLKFLANRG